MTKGRKYPVSDCNKQLDVITERFYAGDSLALECQAVARTGIRMFTLASTGLEEQKDDRADPSIKYKLVDGVFR